VWCALSFRRNAALLFPRSVWFATAAFFSTKLSLPLRWHIGFFGSYEPELREIIRAALPAGETAIDVGANAGWHTLLMARLVGPNGRVLAVEPNPSVREHLRRNIAINRVGQVEVIELALGEAEGTLSFVAPDAEHPASASGQIVADDAATPEASRVPASTLDSLAAERRLERLDLVRIDAEGFEWPMLQGAQTTIARFRPYIIFEFDQAYAARGADSGRLFAEFFHATITDCLPSAAIGRSSSRRGQPAPIFWQCR